MAEQKKDVTLQIDGNALTVPVGSTILQACKQAGIEVPVFCAHERLSVAGNCRMCLVEVKGHRKLAASCAMPVCEGMEVETQSEMVTKARTGNLELLLVNHPLDCPICDQGGECDLQDITMAYGPSASRFRDNKRAVADKYMGPLIKTVMTRCIHCTRCVRFANEVAGVEELGALGRGEDMEITTALEQSMTSPLSGNVIDLCPVGALTAKPSAFQGRNWEFEKIPTIDTSDAVGAHIYAHRRDGKVMRVLPRECPEINEEWITDKTRFSYDGLRYQRLDQPYVRKRGKLVPATWSEALELVAQKLQQAAPKEIAAFVGGMVEVESAFLLKKLLRAFGALHLECRQEGAYLPTQERGDYLFNTPLADLEKADVCLLIGTNPKTEAPLVNIRLMRSAQAGAEIYSIGDDLDLGYAHTVLSKKATVLNRIISGDHPLLEKLRKAKNPVVILGMGALKSEDGEEIYLTARHIAQTACLREGWNGFNILHTEAGRVGALDIGFVPEARGYTTSRILKTAERGDLRFVYLLGADDIPMEPLSSAFVVYQGHHGDRGAHSADVVLPGLAPTEKQGIYVNLEGRVQETCSVVEAPGDAKEDWRILRALSDVVEGPLSYNTREEVLAALQKDHPVFQARGGVAAVSLKGSFPKKEVRRGVFGYAVPNFYATDVICRASPTMAQCIKEILEGSKPKEGR